jgi:hypothetical protein
MRAKLRKATYRNERISRTTLPDVAAEEVRVLCARHHEREDRHPPSPNDRAQPQPKPRVRPPLRPPRRPKGCRNESTEWKPFASSSCHGGGAVGGYQRTPSSPHEAERVTSMRAPRSRRATGSTGSSSVARPRWCCHRCERPASETASPPDPTEPDHEARATATPPLSILSVGYTDTASSFPPVTPARQRKRVCHHL